jgi:exopolyphosphatase
VGVDTRSWVFIDEIDLDALHERGQLRLVLIDHNKLASHQKHLADAVEEIVDHHNDEHLYASSVVRRVVEPVGSAATLVALELLEAHGDDAAAVVLDAGLARLLMGPILLDTVNFAADSARFNEKDTRAYEALKQLASEGEGQSPQALFDKLQAEKFNVASLSSRDLLRKDYKEFHLQISGTPRAHHRQSQRAPPQY